eukprot:925245-Pelagomonas_calceolata.AAC.19
MQQEGEGSKGSTSCIQGSRLICTKSSRDQKPFMYQRRLPEAPDRHFSNAYKKRMSLSCYHQAWVR